MTSAPPAATRMSRSPAPGAPWANVENSLRIAAVWDGPDASRKPRKGAARCSFEALQLDDAALEPDHRGVGAVLGAELRQDVAHLALDGFLAERELLGDFLVGVALCDEAQHPDLRRGQRIVG